MQKILILYFSGAGATKQAAEWMLAALPQGYGAVLSFENSTAVQIKDYGALIIGTPVYHGGPARLVTAFFNDMEPLANPVPAFIYNTCGLYPCNTNRILAKQLKKKNILTVLDRSYRSPASDMSLLLPAAKRMFQFERGIRGKITVDIAKFTQLLRQQTWRGYMPRFRLSSICNAPNKWVGQLVTLTVYLHHGRCTRCGKCIRDCPHHAFEKDMSGYPRFRKKNCENCYRCIHHCPQMALSLSKKRTVERAIKYGPRVPF